MKQRSFHRPVRICVDLLDLSSTLVLLRKSSNGDQVFFFTKQDGLLGWISEKILLMFGRKVDRFPSLFDGDEPDVFTDYRREALSLFNGSIEPAIRKMICRSMVAVSSDEAGRLTRYVAKVAWRFLSRQFEMVWSANKRRNPQVDFLLVHKGFLFVSLTSLANIYGLDLRGYSAPFRFRMPPRNEYYDSSIRYSPTAILSWLLMAWAVCNAIIISIITYCRSRVCGKNTTLRSNCSVLALAYQPAPTDGHNDLYWESALRCEHGHTTICVYSQRLSSKAIEYYRSHTKFLIPIASPIHAFLINGGSAWASAARRVSKRLASRTLVVSRKVLDANLPPWAGAFLLRAEIRTQLPWVLMEMTGARTAWCMLEGNDVDSLGLTLAASRVGGVCFGGTWSMPQTPSIEDALVRNHVLFVWGRRQRVIYEKSQALARKVIEAGYPTAGYYTWEGRDQGERPDWLNKALLATGRRRVVTFYDNICAQDIQVTCEEMRRLINVLLGWLQQRADVLLVLKSKRNWYHILGSNIVLSLAHLEREGALIVRDEKADLQSGLAADVVFGLSASTLACVAASYGKRTVLYDRLGLTRDDVGWTPIDLSSTVRIKNLADLPSALDSALTMPPDTGERGGFVDSYADSMGGRRVAFFMNAVLSGLDKGLSAPVAENEAALLYSECWPIPRKEAESSYMDAE